MALLVKVLFFFWLSTVAVQAQTKPDLKAFCPFNVKRIVTQFDPDLRVDFSANTLAAIFQSIEKRYGKCQTSTWVEKEETISLQFSNIILPIKIEMRKSKILKFAFGPVSYLNDSFAAIFSAIPEAGVYLVKNEKVVFQQNATKLFAAGELIRLTVLDSYQKGIEQKKLSENELVELTDKDKFFSKSVLQNWPTNSKLTLSSVANLTANNEDEIALDLLLNRLNLGSSFPLKRVRELAPTSSKVEAETQTPIWPGNTESFCRAFSVLNSKFHLLRDDPLEQLKDTVFMYGSYPETNGFLFAGENSKDSVCFTLLRGTVPHPLSHTEFQEITRRVLKLLDKMN